MPLYAGGAKGTGDVALVGGNGTRLPPDACGSCTEAGGIRFVSFELVFSPFAGALYRLGILAEMSS